MSNTKFPTNRTSLSFRYSGLFVPDIALLYDGEHYRKSTAVIESDFANKQIFAYEHPRKLKTHYDIMKYYEDRHFQTHLLENVLNFCEYYSVTHSQLEKIVTLEEGIKPGWIKEFIKINNDDGVLDHTTLGLISSVLDKLISIGGGWHFTLIMRSSLFENYGMYLWMFNERCLLPERYEVKFEQWKGSKKPVSPYDKIEVNLIAEKKYRRDTSIKGKTKITFHKAISTKKAA